MNHLDALAEALIARAEAIRQKRPDLPPLDVTRDVPEMAKRCLWVDAAIGAGRVEGPLVSEADLPEQAISLAIGHHRVLLGSLGPTPNLRAVQTVLRQYLNQMIIGWSWLGRQGDDLLLILVGPPQDGDEADEWRDLRSSVERDERVCRKLVWLPPSDSARLNTSIESIIRRTFLACPWLPLPANGGNDQKLPGGGASEISAPQDLDLMGRLRVRLGETGLSAEETTRWIGVLSDPAARPDLIEALVTALEPAP
ncbi:ABC-three component system middle component 1 [Azospirillum sp. BE72]|uniref:ABC-three component system middle component 1 n=1 Tax=Azospirillum sp. BE72 TaxID=2817776 RepID=UPI00285D399F|nr:ABC-three component system middle component 1 [Azospirillum sp. BE72]MDR6772677.1 hypothetical protein [Azospirillum sp. BE72]